MPPTKNTNTGLAKRETIALPVQNITEMETLGRLIAASGMFGAKNAAEGFVIAGICHQTGMSYMEFMETRHFFNGRVSMRADAILSRFNELGGTHKVVRRTPEEASIAVTINGNETVFTLTWADVLKEPFVYRGGPDAQMAELSKPVEKRNIKDKYATPRSRMQMLWARIVSDAIRTVCPQACRGTYTPEEIDDISDRPEEHRQERVLTPSEVTIRADSAASRPEESAAPTPAVPPPAEQSAPAAAPVPSKSPFAKAKEPAAAPAAPPPAPAVDFAVCPFGNEKTRGVRWDAMPLKWLEAALKATDKAMTDEHRAVIRSVIEQKSAAPAPAAPPPAPAAEGKEAAA